MNNYRLEHRDCILGMKEMPEASVDIVVTSPPYNLDIAYGQCDDGQSREEYLLWSERWVMAVQTLLKEQGSFFLNVGSSPSNPLLPHELALLFSKYFVLQNTFHWVKSITVKDRQERLQSVGHFKPINSPRYVTDCHEYVFHFTHQGDVKLDRLAIGVPYADKSNVGRWGHTSGKDLRCRGNTWFIPYKTIRSRQGERPHPATFPEELAAFCMRLHGIGEETMVLDPFVGIGHSALAAKQCEVPHFTGFDMDDAYLEVARRHLKEGG